MEKHSDPPLSNFRKSHVLFKGHPALVSEQHGFDQDWGCTRHTDQRDQPGAFNLHIYHNQIIKTWRNLSE